MIAQKRNINFDSCYVLAHSVVRFIKRYVIFMLRFYLFKYPCRGHIRIILLDVVIGSDIASKFYDDPPLNFWDPQRFFEKVPQLVKVLNRYNRFLKAIEQLVDSLNRLSNLISCQKAPRIFRHGNFFSLLFFGKISATENCFKEKQNGRSPKSNR